MKTSRNFHFLGATRQDGTSGMSVVVSLKFARLLPKDVTRKRQMTSRGVERLLLSVGKRIRYRGSRERPRGDRGAEKHYKKCRGHVTRLPGEQIGS